MLAASLVGFSGASQALSVTVSAAWDPTNVAGASTVGRTYSTAANPLNANSSLTFDTVTELGVEKFFTFTTPFSVTVLDTTASGLDFHFAGTTVIFSGAGTAVAPAPFTTPLFTQGLYSATTGAGIDVSYSQQGHVDYTSDFGGQHLGWTAHFVGQPTQSLVYSNGSASYTWDNVQLSVTLVSATPVPEASTAAMLALGLVPVVGAMRRRRRD